MLAINKLRKEAAGNIKKKCLVNRNNKINIFIYIQILAANLPMLTKLYLMKWYWLVN